MVRRPARAVRRHLHRRRRAGRAGHGRRLRLHRLGLHRHRRGARQPRPTSRRSSRARSDDIVYSNLFTGVHGNYLKRSIRAAGLDPDNLPESDPSKMNFGGDGASKAWKDIWGCGQGIGAVKEVVPAAGAGRPARRRVRGGAAPRRSSPSPARGKRHACTALVRSRSEASATVGHDLKKVLPVRPLPSCEGTGSRSASPESRAGGRFVNPLHRRKPA